MKKSYSRVPGI